MSFSILKTPWNDVMEYHNGSVEYPFYPWGPFYKNGLTLIPAWISNHMPSKVWDEITHPFLNFNGCAVEV